MMSPMVTFALGASILLAFASIRYIPKDQVYTLRRFGRQVRTIGPGAHIVFPLVERIAHKISLLGQVAPIHSVIKLPDGARVLKGEVFFQVLNAERADAVIEGVGGLLQDRISLLLLERAEIDEQPHMRNDQIKRSLNHALRESGLLVTRVQLTLH